MRAIFLQHPMQHWVQTLRASGCVVAPVARVSEVCADDQLRANGVFKVGRCCEGRGVRDEVEGCGVRGEG